MGQMPMPHPGTIGGSLVGYDQELFVESLNNYVYYLSARAKLEDKEKVSAVLQEFKKHIENIKKYDDQYLNFKATLIWAQLNLGYLAPFEAQNENFSL